MKKLVAICAVVMMMLAVSVPAQATLLSDLLVEGATITSGDKLFYNFGNWDSTGDPTVDPAQVFVTPYQNPTNLEYGLKFTSEALYLDSPGSLSAFFDFFVQPTLPGYLISDNTLTMTGTGGDGTYVMEYATDAADEENILAWKVTYLTYGTGTATSHSVYTSPVEAVHVSKSIYLSWGGSTPMPSITEFTQTFSQVPEPSTLVMLAGLSVVLISGFGRKRINR